jgi:hypothetical protein
LNDLSEPYQFAPSLSVNGGNIFFQDACRGNVGSIHWTIWLRKNPRNSTDELASLTVQLRPPLTYAGTVRSESRGSIIIHDLDLLFKHHRFEFHQSQGHWKLTWSLILGPVRLIKIHVSWPEINKCGLNFIRLLLTWRLLRFL